MKAAVSYDMNQPLVIEDVTLDPPQQGEVRVRVAATAICHSDVHYLRGDWEIPRPFIAGHETAGVVEETGPGVTQVQPGDRVVVSLLRSCGRCDFCLSGGPNHCSASWPLDTESRIRNGAGQSIRHGVRVAGFAEYAIVDQSQLAAVPETMRLEAASLLACGVITGFGAVVNTARVEAGSAVVVIGTGGVGLNSVQGAALSGARQVIAVDLLPNKLAAARQFGASDRINAAEVDPVEAVKEITDGRMADYVFVTVGSERAVNQALAMARRAGTVVLVGMPPESLDVSLSVRDLAFRGMVILGSFMGSTRLQIDIPRLIAHYERGNLHLDELITKTWPLEQINEAIESMERGEALRNVIVFDSPAA
ncbi:MAG: Zn-dependent alcohol dehydrogenase [Anaerolineaceae bacterium]|nr:Zn-dependent alcohol dehydrogenase [Anaerolineaceae bacterium]